MAFNPHEPYNGLPPLFPEEKYWKTIRVFEWALKANKALAELKGRLSAIPNPQLFINTLALQEAKDSSAIENVITTNDKLFKAFTSLALFDPQTREVLRYGKVLTDAFEQINKEHDFSLELMEKIYRGIKDEKDGIRETKVMVGNYHQTIYTPPAGRDVLLGMLANWLEYANTRHDIDPLIKMAVLHYQFEAVHPFKDGNGRTGRILNVLFLYANELLDEPVLYLSRYINESRSEYYRLLLSVTQNQNWQNWIVYMLKAVESTAKYTLEKVLAIIKLMEQTKNKIQNEAHDIYTFELVELLFTRVYSKYSHLEERQIASRNTASKYLNKLVEIGILEKEKIGNEYIFKNIALYNLFKDSKQES